MPPRPDPWAVLPINPHTALRAFLGAWWRRWRCPHTWWTPLDGCRCGKEPR